MAHTHACTHSVYAVLTDRLCLCVGGVSGIGQTKEVQVYRLIARNTYENEMFDRASLKLGLGHAIMGTMASTVISDSADSRPPKDKNEIALMLRKGFYYQADEGMDSTQLTDDTLDLIMKRDAKVIEYRVDAAKTEGGEGDGGGSSSSVPSNRFAKASFGLEEGKEDGEWNGEDFWRRMFPEQAAAVGDGFIDDNILMGKRKRKMLHGTYEELLSDPKLSRRGWKASKVELSPGDEYVQAEGQLPRAAAMRSRMWPRTTRRDYVGLSSYARH